ncbi:MAG TPA: FAD-dependent oxidoreductase [Steroidobacteraceae bacterium]|nr:FAD-dependent oxidoreductase [Steroidobacteraceae bacterium]
MADKVAGEQPKAPIVIVGAGPVGVRAAAELLRRCPDRQIVLYGEEDSEPYDRVQLSSFLMGDVREEALFHGMRLPPAPQLTRRLGLRVTAIDRAQRIVRDSRGDQQAYGTLILATGSSPHVPDVPGIALPGVLRFRDWRDTQQLCARRLRSRRAVVLGGGLLGLEAARAMRRFNTEIVVIEHNPQLMCRQLDAIAGQALRHHVEALGIRVVLGDAVKRVCGHDAVAGVALQSGTTIDCDTIVLATGIRCNIGLALQSGIAVGRGIRVDDELRTADPDVHAIGECAEHRGLVHGLVGPGLEQAAVVAGVIAGTGVRYTGSIAATNLKVAGLPVFSVGRLAENDIPPNSRRHAWRNGKGAVTSLVTQRGRLIGACGVGTLQEFQPLREAVEHARRVNYWRLRRYSTLGRLWPERDDEDIAAWPAEAVVCSCAAVTRGALSRAVAGGCRSLEAIGESTLAATACGSCRPLVLRLLASGKAVPAVRGAPLLAGAAVLALLVALGAVLGGNLPDPDSVQGTKLAFWRDADFKQISGYSLVAAVLLSLVITWRKRARSARAGDTALWRLAHVGLAVLAGVTLLAHTGGRIGVNLNLALAVTFLVALVLGAISALAVAREHQGVPAVRVRRRTTRVHLVLTWPLPALLVAHIVKAYFF